MLPIYYVLEFGYLGLADTLAMTLGQPWILGIPGAFRPGSKAKVSQTDTGVVEKAQLRWTRAGSSHREVVSACGFCNPGINGRNPRYRG